MFPGGILRWISSSFSNIFAERHPISASTRALSAGKLVHFRLESRDDTRFWVHFTQVRDTGLDCCVVNEGSPYCTISTVQYTSQSAFAKVSGVPATDQTSRNQHLSSDGRFSKSSALASGRKGSALPKYDCSTVAW